MILGVRADPGVALPVTVAVPAVYPVLVVFWVMVAEAPGDKPETVNNCVEPVVEVIATEPLLTVGVAQVKAASKFVIETVKPSAVAVGVPKVGVRAAPVIEVAVAVAEPSVYPVLVVVIVAVEEVPAATPVTVTKPDPLIETVPDAVAVPAQV